MRRISATALLGLALALMPDVVCAAPAYANTTLGSTLEDGFEATYGGSGLTVYQEAAPSEALSAPSGGTITSWSVRSGDMNAKYELRILRPAGGGTFMAAGTSAPQTVPNAEDKVRGPFAVSLPVKGGDRIALDVIGGLGAPISNTLAPLADELNYFSDPFGDGTTEAPVLTPPLGGSQELLLQASFTPGAPVNTAPPTISGEARVGSTLTGTEGSWEDAASFAFQWQRCAGETCTPIAGAMSASYKPAVADEGQQLRLAVTATGVGGKMTTAYSERSNGVKAGPPPPPTLTGAPTISGEAREPETLTGTPGLWLGNPTSFYYEWLRCTTPTGTECEAIAGATSTSYTVAHADVGATLKLRVTAESPFGTASAESAPTKIVQPFVIKAVLTVGPDPTCTGISTLLDASASKTPNPPITNYRLLEINVPLAVYAETGPFLGRLYEFIFPEEEFGLYSTLYEGPQAKEVVTFTFDRSYDELYDRGMGNEGESVRDYALIILLVEDKSGATARTEAWVKFTQVYSRESRAHCPYTTALYRQPIFNFAPPGKVLVSKTAVTQAIRCTAAVPCTGSLSVVTSPPIAATRGRLARTAVPRQLVLASDRRFRIPAHHRAILRAVLTKAGRALLKRGKTVRAVMRLTSIGRKGSATTRSYDVTLRRR